LVTAIYHRVFGQGGHFFLSSFSKVAILDPQSHRRADGFTPANGGTHLGLGLSRSACAPPPAVALLAAPKIVIDFIDGDGKPAGTPSMIMVKQDVGLSRCQVTSINTLS